MPTKQILVVDDEIGIRELLYEILFDEGYQVHLAENAEQARAFRLNQQPDIVLLDIWMADTDGLTLLKEWSAQQLLTMPVIMMSGHGTIETALEAMRVGAVDFLEKPVALKKLLRTVEKYLQQGLPAVPAPLIQHEQVDEVGMTMVGLPLDLPYKEVRDYFESVYFTFQLQKENGNITRLAEKVGLERTHLYRKLKYLGVKTLKKTLETTE